MPDMTAVPPLSAYLVCADAAKAIDFYIAAFGARELVRVPRPDGKILHASLDVNNGGLLMLTDEMPQMGALSPLSLKGSSVTLHLAVSDCDAVHARAVAAGAKTIMPPQDQFWGDRYAMIEDPSGHRWSIGQRLRDMSAEELVAAGRAAFAGGAGCGDAKGA